MRDLFMSGDKRLAKNYLRMLVEHIVVREDLVEVVGRTDVAVAMMAAAGKGTDLNQPERVLTIVDSWRPRHESNVRPTV